ncbi:hypothetical protein L9F63_023968 [Diploptera punctata]|uniref:Uncharacterized protein n=1 Tax=Diploptera punctata TaxID=6984 RepID=A0AAD8E8I4_DIPPU|nr:hypothetical protein L9F63_023968 [Diploptera punctata]
MQSTMLVHLDKWMMDETQYDFTPKGALKLHTIKQVCLGIKKSWSRVREDIIVKSFKKCGVSNALDGSEDNLIYEEGTMMTKRKESSDDNF